MAKQGPQNYDLNAILRPIPFVRMALPLAAGIAVAETASFDGGYALPLLFLLLSIWGLSVKKRNVRFVFGLLLSVFLFLLGNQLFKLHDERNQAEYAFQKEFYDAGYFIGIIKEPPKKGNRIQLNISVEALERVGEFENVSGNISFSLPAKGNALELEYGDRVAFRALPKQISPPTNPDAFDYRKFMHFKNVHHNAFGKEWEVLILENGKGNPIVSLSHNMRKNGISYLRKYLRTKNEFAVGTALILGYKDEMTEDISLAYANTGAMHVLAVSGLHVGIISSILIFLLGLIKNQSILWRITSAIITLIGIWTFAFVTGLAPSVLRASTMFSFVAIGNAFTRKKNIYNTLAASAFFLLLINPFLLFQPGFQLSYAAVLGIVFFQPLIYRSWYVKNKIGKWIWGITAVSIAAQIGTLPLSLYYFHQFPTYFWLSGLIVIPVAPVILYGGLLLFLFEGLGIPIVSKIFGYCLEQLIWLMNACIFSLDFLPFGIIENIRFDFYDVLLSYFFILLISFFIQFERKVFFKIAAIVIIILSSFYSFKTIKIQEQESIVFYDNKSGILSDGFYKNNRQVFSLDSLDKKSEMYATKGHRSIQGKRKLIETDTSTLPFLHILDKKVILIQENYWKRKSTHSIKTDVVIITKNPFVKIEDIQKEFNPEVIIAASDNSRKKVGYWRSACEKSGIPFYYTKEGAVLYRKSKGWYSTKEDSS